MKNILFLTDFSKNALNAMEYALHLFKGNGLHIYILNVHRTSGYITGDLMSSEPGSSVYESITKKPKKALDKLVKDFSKQYENQDYFFEYVCDYDAFVKSVNQVVRIKDVDLIVMGTNGATGAKEVIFGSNTVSVIRNINCPVLVIPENHKFSKLNKVLFASEKDELFVEESLSPLDHILSMPDILLDILFLEKNSEHNMEKENNICHYFKKIMNSTSTVSNELADKAITSYVEKNNIDLVAKIINKEPFLKRLLAGSATPKLAYKTKVPLLIMHP